MKIQQELPYKRVQSEQNIRYALILTADAKRYDFLRSKRNSNDIV